MFEESPNTSQTHYPEQGTFMLPVNYQEKFGFDPYKESIRLRNLSYGERICELTQQLESHVNHVTKDQAVSIPYGYWLSDGGDVYTSSTIKEINNIKNQIDFNERNGLFYEGILTAVQMAKNSPNELVAIYSPTGKKMFANTPVDGISKNDLAILQKPYDLGQLYFLYYDGEKIINVAVSVDQDDNPWLTSLHSQFDSLRKIDEEEKRIAEYLLSPVRLGNIDEFFKRSWDINHQVFRNVNGRVFNIEEVMVSLKAAFSGSQQFEGVGDIAESLMQNSEVTEQAIVNAYLLVIQRHMQENKLTRINFGGGCGGTTTDLSELSDILNQFGIQNPEQELVSSFSSAFRQLRQTKESKKWHYHDGYCVVCDPDKKNVTKVGPCNICQVCEIKPELQVSNFSLN